MTKFKPGVRTQAAVQAAREANWDGIKAVKNGWIFIAELRFLERHNYMCRARQYKSQEKTHRS